MTTVSNDPLNKVLLPTKKGSETLWTETQRSIHQGRHPTEVSAHLERKMTEVIENLGRHAPQQEYSAALQPIIREERQALISGERMLNKHHQSHAVPLPKGG